MSLMIIKKVKSSVMIKTLVEQHTKQKKKIKKMEKRLKKLENRYEQLLVLLRMDDEKLKLWIQITDRMLDVQQIRQIQDKMKKMKGVDKVELK